MNGQDCIFCKIVSGEIPSAKIYENKNVLAFLDIGPVSSGHTLVIPKSHYQMVHECPADVLSSVAEVLPKIAAAVYGAMEADGYNVLCNNGRAAGQLVNHVHFHIIPRKHSDGVFNSWPAFKYGSGELQQITEKILRHLR